jgi:hypothetical protein
MSTPEVAGGQGAPWVAAARRRRVGRAARGTGTFCAGNAMTRRRAAAKQHTRHRSEARRLGRPEARRRAVGRASARVFI